MTMQLSNSPTAVLARVTGFPIAVPPPVLSAPEISGTNATLKWTAVSDVVCRLGFTPDPAHSNWIALPGDVTATRTNASKLDPLSPSNRFCRVRVLP